MTHVTREGLTMAVMNEHQLAAFLNNGWTVVEETEMVSPATPEYTKTEINRMPVAELKVVADRLGIPDDTGTKLKAAIIDKLGL